MDYVALGFVDSEEDVEEHEQTDISGLEEELQFRKLW